jgi:hypothetical protein
MACCGRRRKAVVSHTASNTQLRQPQNYNTLTTTSNDMLCTKCTGTMKVQRTYVSGDTTRANVSCTSCGNVRIINL